MSISRRVLTGLSATVLTAAAFLYAPIALTADAPPEMVVRTHLLLVLVAVSAVSTWIVAIKPQRYAARLVAGVAGGFNCIWIVSFVGPPVVLASLVAIVMSAIGIPRRFAVAVVAVALVGFCLGLVLLRLTEPPGEHIFG